MMMIKGISALLLFAGQVLPAWCLTIDQVGVFSYLNSILVVMSVIAVWGTDRYSLKNIAIKRQESKSPDASIADSVATGATSISQLVSSAYAVVFLNSLLLVAGLLFWLWKLRSDYTVAIGVIAAGILVVRALAVLSAAITKGTDRVVVSELVYSLGRPLVFAVLCAIAYLTFEQVSLEYVLVSFAASFLFAAVICYVINLPIVMETKKLCGVSSVSRLYQGAFFFLLVSVGLPLMANINTIQLGNMCDKPDVALYAIAAKLVSLVLLGLVSANLLIAPKLSPMFSKGNIDGMKKLIRNNNLVVAGITCVPVLIIVFFAEQILTLFGVKYVPAALPLRVLMIGQAVSVFCGPVVLTATMAGLQKVAAYVVLCACLINWLACFAMIPHYGIMGAVIASVFANILLNVALALMIYKRIGLNVTMLNLIK